MPIPERRLHQTDSAKFRMRDIFPPTETIRCVGRPAFRSQGTRDYACLLDFDVEVESWTCLPLELHLPEGPHVPDFAVKYKNACVLVDILADTASASSGVSQAAADAGYGYRSIRIHEIPSGHRLQNARDLLRYSRCTCPLGDRIRILAALDDRGSLTLAECIPAFQETRPIAGLASLVLNRFLEIELDDAPIGTDTIVRRARYDLAGG